jgi:flagellar assembly factor FliW
MELQGTRIGSVAYEESDLITLPSGLVGMPDLKRFLVLDFEEELPFKWLQSVDEPGVGFLVAEPAIFRPDFALGLEEEDLRELKSVGLQDIVVFVLCTYDAGKGAIAGNLRGPVIVDSTQRLGRQLVLEESAYGTHENLNISTKLPKMKKAKEQAAEQHCG